MTTKEQWKDIVGYEGLYQVSNLGRVKSLGRIGLNGKFYKGKILKLADNRGYKYVCLLDNSGKRKTHRIHRLVAIAFIPNPDNLPEVNHIDGNKTNNCFSNLEWVSHKENMKHAFENNLKKNFSGGKTKLTEDVVKFIRDNYIPRDRKFGGTALAKKFGVTDATIRDVVFYRSWKEV